MDSNNSLKRLATRANQRTADSRTFATDYFLLHEFVNKFTNEVKLRQSIPKPDLRPPAARAHDDIKEEDDEDDTVAPAAVSAEDREGDPTDGEPGEPSPCATNWKAAAADTQKRTWDVFEETSIFACACQHGLILWIADMIRSGEQ